MKLTEHHFALPGQLPPPVDETLLFDYYVAGNTTFARGRRPGIEVCIPLGFRPMRGLVAYYAYAQWGYPRVPARFLEMMVKLSQARCSETLTETLFHLSFSTQHDSFSDPTEVLDYAGGWHLEYPEQNADDRSVVPTHTGVGTSTERAIVELHSHHIMSADFSPQDDVDEAQGFRIYAVIGRLFDRPEIRVRVGLYGHFFEYPASEFFELPESLTDCVGIK